MIDKLYNLKKTQTDQKLLQKAQIEAKINNLNDEILVTQTKINTTGVQKFGAISDFTILAIHKNTMKEHVKKLEKEKLTLNNQLETIVEQIVELQKESEQYEYLLNEQKKEKLAMILKAEQEASEEYIQSKYIRA